MSLYNDNKCACCDTPFAEDEQVFTVQLAVVKMRHHRWEHRRGSVPIGKVRFERRSTKELWCLKCTKLGRKAAKGEYID